MASDASDTVDTFNTFWSEVEFTASLRPKMLEDEVELLLLQGVSVLHCETSVGYGKGSITLTTHRVIWQPAEGGDLAAPIAGPLSRVARADVLMGTWRKSSKVSLFLLHQLDDGAEPQVKLKFHGKGRDAFLSKIQAVLEQEAWKPKEVDASVQRNDGKELFSVTSAGIKGIIREKERLRNAEKRLASTAFEDLDSLIEKAKDVVQVIERFSEKGGSNNADEEDQFAKIVQSLGVASPVTRELAGNAFHEALAREIVDILSALVNRLGSVITLTDVYCLVNRARGTELCSPEDILKASKLMEGLGLQFSLRTFDSGLLALQHASHKESSIQDRILTMATERMANGEGLVAFMVAQELHCGVPLAAQYLDVAEKEERLVRDESPEGLQFYPNRFPEYLAAAGLMEPGQ